MKLLKLFVRHGKEISQRDVTPEAQKLYEEQLKERARTGRTVTLIVCVMNVFVAGILGMTGMGWLLFIGAAVGVYFSFKGRELGRILHIAVMFMTALVSYSIIVIMIMGSPEKFEGADLLFKFMAVYSVLTSVFLLRSKHISSWFEYAGSYRCRYLGKRFFE